ncbi:MAG: DUF2207 domain-containing protein [Bacilli bacterium]|nr:DUF2207 domain-containing protein [Bacilli bacterium]MDD4734038.1 DUF2207 domain-containing protein [Bacilli bacterium]
MTEIYGLLLITYYVFTVGFMFFLYYKNGLSHPIEEQTGVETPPSALTYSELSVLLYNKIIPSVFICTVIDLISKNFFIVEKTDKEYYLIPANITYKGLTNSEKYVLEMLSRIRDDKGSLSLTQIFNYCDSKKNKDGFSIDYGVWKKIARKEVTKKFYEEKKFYNAVNIIVFIGVVFLIINLLFGLNTIAGFILIIPIAALPQYFNMLNKRTKESNIEYNKWLCFKDYLEKTSSFSLSRTDTFKYLSYGIILDVESLSNKIFKTDFIKYLHKALCKCISAIGIK